MGKISSDVPVNWWRTACEAVSHPIACVSVNHHYIWCNNAYERLIGYSITELIKHTWMDITVSDDVAGDLESVQALIEGKAEKYTLSKRYRHRRGNEIPIQLTVWRFPRGLIGEIKYMIVEAVPVPVSLEEMDRMHENCSRVMRDLEEKMRIVEMYQEKYRPMEQQSEHKQIVNVGNNSPVVFYWIIAAVVATVGLLGYIAWLATWNVHHGQADPPTIEIGAP